MALIPLFFPDCVVAIGVGDEASKREWKASGFLYGHLSDVNGSGEKKYRIYLVTNRHVIDDIRESHIYLRFNPQEMDEPVHDYNLPFYDKEGKSVWVAHPDPDIDVAVTNINYMMLREHAMQVNFFRSDVHAAGTGKLVELGTMEGDFCYVLGFPMGLVSNRRNTVIVRNGTIARIRGTLLNKNPNPEYLIDSFVFPGNSGGPLVSKPESIAIKGTKAQSSAYLIGIITSSVRYRDAAVSTQTKRVRIIFEENSGLAGVHPVDYIDEAIDEHLSRFGDRGRKTEVYHDRHS
ncbi:MAG: serine protease [Candidatus Thermoplasmatota archaeon]|jgi:S1-C subfamily serine protease|nr:serine protease [Candidatus Thermoplasmatota archaeon]MDP7265787.1 serine protease [Candidatus Thermoplasmatota archaeon]